MRFLPVLLVISVVLGAWRPAAGWVDPETTVRTADEILRESMTIPVRQIPQSLLAQARGVAIVPNVIKIGFVAALRRGHGVVMVRDANGAWTLPQFVTLTGGSVGWQAGVQDTDLILVFMTQKSVDGLLAGKFTIGADASAAAGPVGRNAAAATDARLKAEILSYSRSRGLFVGVSLDGSVIEVNPVAFQQYYGVPLGQQVTQIPESATRLVQNLIQATEPPPAEAAAVPGAPTAVPTPAAPAPPTTIREQLAASAKQLFAIVDEQWRDFLALPEEVFTGTKPPPLAALKRALSEYDRVVQEPKYDKLVASREFQTTYGLLREYVEELSRGATSAGLALPPPPTVR